MSRLGVTLVSASPGRVEIAVGPTSISQHHGSVHAGAVSAVADTAAGYAALSLMPPGHGVLTTEFTINFLTPAVGEGIVACGRVVECGRVVTVAQTDVFAVRGGCRALAALLTATLISVDAGEGSGSK